MNKKKGYPRKPYSFERVLKDLADDIGYENIETVIEKKRKAIEHISNPNFKDRQLNIQDGLELDIHCNRKGHDTSEEIINNLLRLGESIGDVMEETRKALDDDKVDENEKEQISIEVVELEQKIGELKLKLNLGEKTDYKKQRKREF